MKKLSIILMLFLLSFSVFAQIEVSGTVTSSEDNSALPGVTVVEKGTSNATMTDAEGKYVITVKENSTLGFSYIGFVAQDVAVNGQSVINITLVTETTGIDEVVVVGYGVTKKSLLTGSISQVKAEELEGNSNTRADQAIQGRTAGVAILPTSGSPGAGSKIRIRGTNSNGNSNPLYIVDGMKTGDINNIDPSDIASIEVLKDAASCAIYGTEGANGVILISTKSGKAGVTKINYDFMYGIQSARTNMELMNAEQYKTWMQEAGVATISDRYNADTDWLSEIFQNAPMQKHHLSFTGGSDKTSYMISGSYLNQDGIVGGDKANYDRYTARVNVKSEVKSWLTVGANMSFAHSDQKYIGEDDEYRSAMNSSLLLDPLTPVFYDGTPAQIQSLIDDGFTMLTNEDGKYYSLAENVTGEVANPLAILETYNNNISQDKLLGSAYVTIKPIEGLSITSRVGLDLAYQTQHWWAREYYFSTENSNTVMNIDDRLNKWNTWLWENFASYTKSFGEHTLTALAGYSAQKYTGPWYSLHSGPMVGYGDNFAYHTTGESDQVGSSMGENTMASAFGRLSYDFGGKYMFEASIRRDGSSVFPPEHKYGTFPSFSAGWTISNEDFFAFDFIDFLKVRGSWGANGSKANLGGNEDIVFWDFGGRYPDANGTYIYGASINRLPNSELIWERTEMMDFGLDMRFLDSKLSVSVDYYNKITKGLLATGSGPLSVGNNYPTVNAGNVRNKGFDVELGFRNNDNEFKYGVNLNFSTVDNNVEELIVDAPVRGDNLRGHDLTWFEEGYPIWYFKGYKTDGIDPETGDVMVVDVSGDGVIGPEDQTYIGDPHANLLFGGSLFASYKGFDFNLFFQGTYGNDIFMGWYRTDRPEANKPAYFFEDRWTATNTNASFPAADNTSDYIYRSDLMVSNGSYLRIKQLQLGYTLPSDKVSALGLSSLRVFVSLDDYFTITKYKGLDPEAGSSNNARQGIDRGLYPAAGKLMFGLSINL